MLYPSEQGQYLISYRKTIIDQHEKEIRYLQDVFMAMEQNYIDSEYEGKLEFQSMWDDLKNKVQRESRWARTGRGKCSRLVELEEIPLTNKINKTPVATVGPPTAFCTFVKTGQREDPSEMSGGCILELKSNKEIIWLHSCDL